MNHNAPEGTIVNVQGKRVGLGPIHRDHIPLYLSWENDLGTQRTAGHHTGPQAYEQIEGWYERRIVNAKDESWFAVYETRDWKPVGFTALRDIDYLSRSAEFGITIGTEFQNQGYGTEATILTLDYAFTALGLGNVMLTVAEFSYRGQRAYEKAGFREFGRRTRVWPMGGRLWDEVFMECLADDFVSPVLAKVFAPDIPRDT